MLPSRSRVFQGRPHIFQQENAQSRIASIPTTLEQNSPGAKLACLQCRPFINWKHSAHHEMKNTTKTLDCWAARIQYQSEMGQHSCPTSPAAACRLLLKDEEMPHSGKHDHVPTFSSYVAAIKFKITFIFRIYRVSGLDVFSVLVWMERKFIFPSILFLLKFYTIFCIRVFLVQLNINNKPMSTF